MSGAESNVPEIRRCHGVSKAWRCASSAAILRSGARSASLAAWRCLNASASGTTAARVSALSLPGSARYCFVIYQSNNILPVTDGSIRGYNCPFGHPAGLTWASQFIDTDAVKLVNQIGTGVYSVCAYGFKVTEPSYVGNVYTTPGVG